MLETLLNSIATLSSSEAENLLTSAGENVIEKYKNASAWRKMLVGTGDFFLKHESQSKSFFGDLSIVLSKENMSNIAKNLRTEDGYELKQRLYKLLMQLMSKYEIPYEVAEPYSMRIMYEVLEQLREIDPDKYEHYFLQEWRDEQESSFQKLQARLDKMSSDLTVYNQAQIAISSSGQMDLSLKRSTLLPSMGIEFFTVDDERFQDEFEEHRYDELVYVRGRCREETIYCVLNELWRLDEKRPIYVVKNEESWHKLQAMSNRNNIYIPWFYADEIVAIENNTNIFVLDENTPAYTRDIINLRPRTRDTLYKCLQNAGMECDEAYALLEDTHGLYIPMKKRLFKGDYLKQPVWMNKVSDKVKKICLLLGSWEEIEGDKLIIETLYDDSYEHFQEEILPYTVGEDPLLHIIKRNGSIAYYLASTQNTWDCLDISIDEPIWKKFVNIFLEVLNEAENLFVYDDHERVMAQLKGETLFWSETIRKGMVKTLIMKGVYKKGEDTQISLDGLVSQILSYVQSEKQWSYIASFWSELCEISPMAVLDRLEKEFEEPTGLMELFENQTSDFLFGRNAYVNILWGVEQFLVQKDYFWSGFRWLLKLDNKGFEYKSNSPKDIFCKVFCTWANFSALESVQDKITAAEIAVELNYNNAWQYLYDAIEHSSRSIFGDLSSPKYREHAILRSTTIGEMRQSSLGYLRILLEHMDFSVERWIKVIRITEDQSDELKKEIIEQLLYEVEQMSDSEVTIIKNNIREIIYRHRYFSSSSWAMSDDKVNEYEQLLNEFHTKLPEYEYAYLFRKNGDHPLLHPAPFDEKGKQDDNEIATEKLIQEKLQEFKNKGYQIGILAEVCAEESYSSLGMYLARYWDDGIWNFDIFKELLAKQESGQMAIDYMSGTLKGESSLYPKIIEELSELGYSDELLAKIYRVEASWTKSVPLVSGIAENIKKIFWQTCIGCDESNIQWALNESKKYALLDEYLDQIHRLHYRKPLTAEEIYDYLEGIEDMPHAQGNQMTGYHIKQLLEVVQNAYLNDPEKCMRISHLEILFMNLLEWNDMKCFHHMIKKSPELLAQLIAGIFKRDHVQNNSDSMSETYVHNMYTIYDKAHFCPTEDNGEVSEEKLEQWIVRFKELLEKNDQISLFSSVLGRLFSFSPIGKDGHEPCEAVRMMIEKYGDDTMINRYKSSVYNRRGVFSPSAGKEEMRMAEEFKANADYLVSHYPVTARIFYGLFDIYKRESERERKDAENGWY